MLRTLVLLALAANALFFAWAQGYLAPLWPPPRQAEREPGRIGAQVRPEAITVLPATAASAAVSAARQAAVACMEAGPFSDADAGKAEAALAEAGVPAGSWQREREEPRALWALLAGRPADDAARERRRQELEALKLPLELADRATAAPELAGAFVLSRHASRDSAELALAALAGRSDMPAALLSELGVVAVPPQPLQIWLRAARAGAELQAQLFALDRGFRPCVGRP
jgi:hypothetical protein